MAFGREIKRLRENSNISAQKLADLIGVDADRLRKWEQKDGNPREEDTLKIESFFGMSIKEIELLDSIKKFLNVPHETQNDDVLEQTYIQRRRIQKQNSGPFMVPLVPVSVQAGYRKSFNDSDFVDKLEYYPIVPGIDHHGAIWRFFQVDGDSMLPFLNNGDYVLANQVPKEDWSELKDYKVYVIVTESLVTVKYVAKRKNDFILIPLNEDKFPQMALNIVDVKEIWKYRRHIGWNASSGKKLQIKI